jgi:hypothetical protein
MANNFLNRKKFNLDSFYNNSYKEVSCRKTLIHPYLKTYIDHINIDINPDYINYNNLGIVNNINNNNINYNIIENTIIIDSKDTSYNNSFNLNVYFNPCDINNLTISKINIKNIKYIEIVNILLPIYNLIKTEIFNNNELNQYINDNINILNINHIFDTDKYIDNIYINNNDWEINYSILINDNKYYYSIEKNNNIYKTFEYTKIFSNVYNDKIIYLKISQFDNHNLISSNDNINYLIPLCSNKIINNKKIYNRNIRSIIFKNSFLPIINKLEIKFTDYNDNKLSINNLDKNTNIKTSKSYIRHPKNNIWQTHIVLKVGIISFEPTNSI